MYTVRITITRAHLNARIKEKICKEAAKYEAQERSMVILGDVDVRIGELPSIIKGGTH